MAMHHFNLVSCTSWAVAVKLKKNIICIFQIVKYSFHIGLVHPKTTRLSLKEYWEDGKHGDQALLLPSPAYVHTWLEHDSSINQILIYQLILLLSPDFPVQVSVQLQ